MIEIIERIARSVPQLTVRCSGNEHSPCLRPRRQRAFPHSHPPVSLAEAAQLWVFTRVARGVVNDFDRMSRREERRQRSIGSDVIAVHLHENRRPENHLWADQIDLAALAVRDDQNASIPAELPQLRRCAASPHLHADVVGHGGLLRRRPEAVVQVICIDTSSGQPPGEPKQHA
jgi:hypothetical protein